MINLLISIVFVAAVVVLLQKGFNNTIVFLFLGLVLAVIIELTTQSSVAQSSSGVLFFDIFEAFKEQLSSSFATVGLSLLPIFGYASYMNKIGASSVLGKVVSEPVKKSRNPYFVGVAMAILVCGIMRIAIVSAFAIMALLFSTLYPAMLKAGLSKKTTMSAIFLGTCFDWGPADFVVAQVLGGAGQSDIADYFLSASVIITPIALVVVALISGFIMKYWDNKDNYVIGSDAPEENEEAVVNVPKWYLLLPLLPLFIIIIFSKVFFANISVSVVTAVLISMIVSFVVESLRKKQLKERVKDMTDWISTMGQGFANLFLLVAAIQFYAKMLSVLGGFTYLMNLVMNTGVSGWLLFAIIGLLVFVLAVLMGDPSAISAVLAAQVYTVATSLGIPFYAAVLPMQTANAFRCLSIGTGMHMQYCANYAGCGAIDILKRCIIQCFVIFIIVYFGAMFILA